jgi:hypothetical protein
MKIKLGQVGGLLLVVAGAASIVAALGGMGSAGIQSWPGQWVLGAAGLICGRLLLSAAFDLDGASPAPVVAIQSDPEDAGHRLGATGPPASQEQAETDWFAAATKL